MQLCSGLNLLVFADVMEAISRQFRVDLPWKLLYADDLVVSIQQGRSISKLLHLDDEFGN